jgi:N-acetylmuramoyl-L-alanine amidase
VKIVLNIGHGGGDSGAVAQDGTEEHKFNKIELAPILVKELEKAGHSVQVVIQERNFTELPARINALKPDLIISLHSNCFNGKASGSEVLFWNGSKKGKALAERLQAGIVRALGLPDRGVKELQAFDRGAGLLQRTKAVAVILEPFFIDNPKDLETARMNLPALARGVAGAVA